jgi:hydrogenase/urease accessory protein HupE
VRRLCCLALLAVALVAARSARAHQFAPALLELRESGHAVHARWREPAIRVQGSRLRPVLPAGCVGIGAPSMHRDENGMEALWQIDCPAGLRGQTIGVEGIASSGADVLVRVELADGRLLSHVLTADADTYRIPEAPSRLELFASYGKLGFAHILGGYDHLLFILGLTLLVGFNRRLAWTITAFTVGHSITLGLAVLGFVHVAQRPVEIGIAASLYYVALELVARPRRSLLRERPWAIAGLFGLLHGLGFAGALADIGLPSGEIPLALLAFNVGIEIGQLLLVGVVLAAAALLRRLPGTHRPWLRLAPAYAIGSLAVFWILARI